MTRWLMFLMAVALLCGCGAPKKRKTPPRRQVLSPTGGFLVTAETPQQQQQASPGVREIVISPRGNPSEIIRFPFPRNVELSWAPGDSAVAFVDLLSDFENHVLIWELPSGRPLFEIRREDTCVLNPRLPCGDLYARVFFSNIVWLTPNRLQITVEMSGPSSPNLPPVIKTIVVAGLNE